MILSNSYGHMSPDTPYKIMGYSVIPNNISFDVYLYLLDDNLNKVTEELDNIKYYIKQILPNTDMTHILYSKEGALNGTSF